MSPLMSCLSQVEGLRFHGHTVTGSAQRDANILRVIRAVSDDSTSPDFVEEELTDRLMDVATYLAQKKGLSNITQSGGDRLGTILHFLAQVYDDRDCYLGTALYRHTFNRLFFALIRARENYTIDRRGKGPLADACVRFTTLYRRLNTPLMADRKLSDLAMSIDEFLSASAGFWDDSTRQAIEQKMDEDMYKGVNDFDRCFVQLLERTAEDPGHEMAKGAKVGGRLIGKVVEIPESVQEEAEDTALEQGVGGLRISDGDEQMGGMD